MFYQFHFRYGQFIERPDWGAGFIKLIGDAFLVGTTNNPIE